MLYALALASAITLISLPAFGLNVALNPERLESQVYVSTYAGGSSSDYEEVFLPDVVPAVGTATASSEGGLSSTFYSISGAAISFSSAFEVAAHPESQSWVSSQIHFSPDEDVQYVLDGAMSSTTPQSTLSVELYSVTSETTLFMSEQTSLATPNETFELGGLGGDWLNRLSGSATGTLLAGHVYSLYMIEVVQNTDALSVAGAGSGTVRLTFVPEPTTAAFLGLGLLGLAVRRPR